MKFTVLGCYSPYPSSNGGTPGYLIEAYGKKILLDCGSGVLSKLASFMPPYELDAVILSHLHHDHIADFFVLQYAILTANRVGKRKTPLTVYAPVEPASWFEKLKYESFINLHELNEQSVVDIEDKLTFRFHKTEHGEHCYAMQVTGDNGTTLLYGADSGPNTKWTSMCVPPNLFVCEATYLHKDVPKDSNRHLSAKQAGEAAKAIGTKQLLLTHLYPEYELEDILREAHAEFTNVKIAQPGLSIEL